MVLVGGRKESADREGTPVAFQRRGIVFQHREVHFFKFWKDGMILKVQRHLRSQNWGGDVFQDASIPWVSIMDFMFMSPQNSYIEALDP